MWVVIFLPVPRLAVPVDKLELLVVTLELELALELALDLDEELEPLTDGARIGENFSTAYGTMGLSAVIAMGGAIIAKSTVTPVGPG